MSEFVFRLVVEVPEFPSFYQWLGWVVIVGMMGALVRINFNKK